MSKNEEEILDIQEDFRKNIAFFTNLARMSFRDDEDSFEYNSDEHERVINSWLKQTIQKVKEEKDKEYENAFTVVHLKAVEETKKEIVEMMEREIRITPIDLNKEMQNEHKIHSLKDIINKINS